MCLGNAAIRWEPTPCASPLLLLYGFTGLAAPTVGEGGGGEY